MPTILPTKSIYYDNVNLIAQPQYTISSRSEIPEEKFRICVSPMAAIVGKEFAVEAYKLGLTVFLHRFKGIDDQIDILKTINPSYGHQKLFCSVGLNEEKEVKKLIKNGAKNILIDIANGYLDDLVKFTAKLLKEYPYPEFRFCVGNVHSADGVDLYEKLDPFGLYLRVGIGNGGQCTTTTKATGYGRGQITEIMECVDATNTIYIIADGGISNSANAAKAFAAGANYVMLGSYFSKAKEAQNVIDGEYKCWGSASDYNMQKFGTRRRHSEGKVTEFDESEVKPLKVLVDDLWGGISSAVSYSGNDSLTSFIGNGVFEIKS
jgi:IMP dehydrogenase/GMP reductase